MMLAMYVGFRFFLRFLRSAPQPGCVWIRFDRVPCLQASSSLFAVLAKLAEAVASQQVTADSGRCSTLLVFCGTEAAQGAVRGGSAASGCVWSQADQVPSLAMALNANARLLILLTLAMTVGMPVKLASKNLVLESSVTRHNKYCTK